MEREELEQWLCGSGTLLLSPITVAAWLGLPVADVADTTLLRTAARVRSLRFTLALLRDRFVDDTDVHDWLAEPRCALGGLTAREAILAGKSVEVEEIAVEAWNEVSLIEQGA